MRLVKTQAGLTRDYLRQAEAITMEAIRNNSYVFLRQRLEELIGPMAEDAINQINDLALYETEYTVKKIRKYIRGRRNLKIPVDSWVLENVKDLTVSTSVNRESDTIQSTYINFFETKVNQVMNTVNRFSDEDDVDLEDSVSNMFGGLFNVQNLALAGVAVIGAVNAMRSGVVEYANDTQPEEKTLYVKWVTMLDANVCPDCEEMEGQTFVAGEEPDDIPLHANCRCTWDIVES